MVDKLEQILKGKLADFFELAQVDDEECQKFLQICELQRKTLLDIPFWDSIKAQILTFINLLSESQRRCDVKIIDGAVQIDTKFIEEQKILFLDICKALHPWRKGPFLIDDIFLDGEWRSDQKWSRIEKELPDMENKIIADFGCNNGYYLYRMLQSKPKSILGCDPNARFFLQYEFLNTLCSNSSLFYEMAGVEHLPLLPKMFDIFFCMGVIYHRKDPITMLQHIKDSIKPSGTAVIESITIPGISDVCLFPKDRYSQMRNVYFIPTSITLVNWMERVGFQDVRIIDESQTTIDEQRKTQFATFASLESFLDPTDSTKTVEGYSSPRRTVVVGRVA